MKKDSIKTLSQVILLMSPIIYCNYNIDTVGMWEGSGYILAGGVLAFITEMIYRRYK